MTPRPYVIASPSYCVSAGVRVMHGLCHELNSLGFDARLLLTANISPPGAPLINHELNTPVINGLPPDEFQALMDQAIFVCSDGFPGNPLNAKRVVRYILGREVSPVAPGEFKLHYSRAFAADKAAPLQTLYYLPSELGKFNPHHAPARTQDMLWLGKGAKFCSEPPPGAVEISYTWPPTRAELAEQLRRTRYLYSYDVVSATNLEAILCGAVVIVKHLSYHDWEWTRADMDQFEFGTGGFAFDDSEEEIERAFNTRGELLARCRAIVAGYRPQLLNFVDASQHYFRL